MDQKAIGKFIADVRREKHMTQQELGDALGVSDKTISKWETGRGLPDPSLMLPLSHELGITVNELLSGKRLPDESSYQANAENNFISLAREEAWQRGMRLSLRRNLIYFAVVSLFVAFIRNFAGDVMFEGIPGKVSVVVGFIIAAAGVVLAVIERRKNLDFFYSYGPNWNGNGVVNSACVFGISTYFFEFSALSAFIAFSVLLLVIVLIQIGIRPERPENPEK